MGLMSPFLARQRAREQPFADMLDLGVGSEEAGSVVGHCRVLVRARSRTGPKLWLVSSALELALVGLASDPIVGRPRRRAARTRRNWRRTSQPAWPPWRRSPPDWPRCPADRE